MADDPRKTSQADDQNFDTHVAERPLDPTRNAADLIGDTSGLTGVTQGTPQQTGAEPEETIQDDSYIQGGSAEHVQKPNPTGIPKEAVSDKLYQQQTKQGMSSYERQVANDTASEDETMNTQPASGAAQIDSLTNTGILQDTDEADDYNSPNASPSVQGEQSVSGDMPAPESDDDTLQNAQNMGMQMDETTEHPEEVDIARDVDEGEQAVRNS